MNHIPDKTLQDYFENCLSPDEATSVAAHLQECESCRHTAAAYRAVFDGCCTEPNGDFSEGFEHAVMRGVREAPEEKSVNRGRVVDAVLFAATAVLLLRFLPLSEIAESASELMLFLLPGSVISFPKTPYYLPLPDLEYGYFVLVGAIALVFCFLDGFIGRAGSVRKINGEP